MYYISSVYENSREIIAACSKFFFNTRHTKNNIYWRLIYRYIILYVVIVGGCRGYDPVVNFSINFLSSPLKILERRN